MLQWTSRALPQLQNNHGRSAIWKLNITMIATHLNMCFACCTLKVFLFKLHSQVESPKPCRVLACEVLLDHSIGFAAAAKVPLGDGAEVPGLCNDSNILGVSQTLINTSTCSS
jgi:hypothetical protein